MGIYSAFPSPAFGANQDEYDLDVQEQLTSEHALLTATDFCDEKRGYMFLYTLEYRRCEVNDTCMGIPRRRLLLQPPIQSDCGAYPQVSTP